MWRSPKGANLLPDFASLPRIYPGNAARFLFLFGSASIACRPEAGKLARSAVLQGGIGLSSHARCVSHGQDAVKLRGRETPRIRRWRSQYRDPISAPSDDGHTRITALRVAQTWRRATRKITSEAGPPQRGCDQKWSRFHACQGLDQASRTARQPGCDLSRCRRKRFAQIAT
jgi:hypothetical protein